MIKSYEQAKTTVSAMSRHEYAGALYWLCLGKAHLAKIGGSHANVRCTVADEYRDFAEFKKAILERLTSVDIITMTTQVTSKNIRNMRVYNKTRCELTSKNHPKLTKIWQRMVEPLGRRTMDKYAMSLLAAPGLAIFYQDYGMVLRAQRENPDVIMDNLQYSAVELKYMAKAIVNNWGIIFRVGKAKHGYRLRLRRKDNLTFFNLVEPYLVSSKARLIERDGPAAKVG